jgi:hypothetical protein
MLSGRIAFDATGQMAILAAKLEGRAKRLKDCAVVAIPSALDALVAKALSRRPGDRFSSAREMQQAWRALGPATEAPKAQLGQTIPPTYATQTALTAGTHHLTRVGGFVPRVGLLVASLGVFGSAVAVAIALHKPKPRRRVRTSPPNRAIKEAWVFRGWLCFPPRFSWHAAVTTRSPTAATRATTRTRRSRIRRRTRRCRKW